MATNNSNYKITVSAELDTSGITAQLNNLSKTGAESSIHDLGLTFQEANAIMSKSIEIIDTFVQQVYSMDEALTEFKKVSDLSGTSLDSYVDGLTEAGKQVARTGSEMVEAATEFRKSGFNDDDAATLALIASRYQNVADEALSAGEAANFIISQMKAFNIEASNAEHIIDAVNQVSNTHAVSSSDLATNIGKASAALAVGNNTYEQSLALLTGGTEITRNASRVARGLVSVQSRLNQVVDDASSTGQKLTEWYEEHNIAIYDQEGQLRSLYNILKDLAPQWETLTTNEKDYYLNIQAGANQSQNLAAILSNFNSVLDAEQQALNSSNSALEENAKYMESLEAKTNSLKATLEELGNSVVTKQLISTVLDLANGVLEALNSDLGVFVTRLLAISGVSTGVMYFLSVFGTALAGFVSGPVGIAAVAIGAIATAGLSIYEAYKKANPTLEDATEKLTSLNGELQTNKERLEQINAMDWEDKTPEIIAEKNAIEEENEKLKEQIELQQQLQTKAAKSELGRGDTSSSRAATLAYALSKANKELSENGKLTKSTQVLMTHSRGEIENLIAAIKVLIDNGEELTKAEQDLYDVYNKFEQNKIYVNAVEEINSFSNVIKNANDEIGININQLYADGEQAGKTKVRIAELAAQVMNLNSTYLTSSQKVEALLDIATAAGVAAENLQLLHDAKNGNYRAGQALVARGGGGANWASNYLKDLVGGKWSGVDSDSTTTTNTGGGGSNRTASTSATKAETSAEDSLIKKLKEEISTRQKLVQAELDTVNARIGEMDLVATYIQDYADKEIDAIQAKIDALDAENDAIEEQIELEQKQANLAEARAKKSLVFKDGRYQYVGDTDAVSSAQTAISKYEREQELQRKKNALEAEKKQWEEYKDGWSSLTSTYDIEQGKILANEKYGINMEQSNWTTRLNNLKRFVDQYNAEQERLGELSAVSSALDQAQSTAKTVTVQSNGKAPAGLSAGTQVVTAGGTYTITAVNADGSYKSVLSDANNTTQNRKYASGTTSAAGGLSLVGERGAELRVLNQGDGIIPADITKNLMQLGSIDPKRLMGSLLSGGSTFTFGNITLPNVTDAQSFVSGIKRLAYQTAYKRA